MKNKTCPTSSYLVKSLKLTRVLKSPILSILTFNSLHTDILSSCWKFTLVFGLLNKLSSLQVDPFSAKVTNELYLTESRVFLEKRRILSECRYVFRSYNFAAEAWEKWAALYCIGVVQMISFKLCAVYFFRIRPTLNLAFHQRLSNLSFTILVKFIYRWKKDLVLVH